MERVVMPERSRAFMSLAIPDSRRYSLASGRARRASGLASVQLPQCRQPPGRTLQAIMLAGVYEEGQRALIERVLVVTGRR